MDLAFFQELLKMVNLCEPSFCVAVAAIIFNPLFWNVVARWEHRTRRLTSLFGSPYVACYCLGFVILLLNVGRSHSMTVAMKTQPRWELLDRTEVYYAGVVFMVVGTVLVVSSFLALGFTGTFLGDYFGILMEEKVTGFPFNLIENPMYWGSTANYLGLALMKSYSGLALSCAFVGQNYITVFNFPFTRRRSVISDFTAHSFFIHSGSSPIGLILTAVVAVAYKVAIHFEGPFTEYIYQERSQRRKHE